MHQSISNSMLRNRRSSSVISEHASKRSSISMSNLNIQSYTSSQLISSSNINNNQKQSMISNSDDKNNRKAVPYINNRQQQANPNTISSVTQQHQSHTTSSIKQQNIVQQSLLRIKKLTIQPYKIVKKHIKQNIMSFTQQQLRQVYFSLSNSLKSIQKLNNVVVNGLLVQGDVNVGSFNREKYQYPLESTIGNNNNDINNSNCYLQNSNVITNQQRRKSISNQSQYYNQSIYGSNNSNSNDKNIEKIKQLQQQLQKLRNNHSQQIRQMIQTHQQQIGYMEKQHYNQLQQIKSINQQLLQKIKIQTESKIKNIIYQCQSKTSSITQQLKKQHQQNINNLNKSQNQLMQTKYKQLIQRKYKELIQRKYKQLIKQLMQRLNTTKQMYEQLKNQYCKRMQTIKEMVRRCVVRGMKSSGDDNGRFLKVLLGRLMELLSKGNENNSNNIIDKSNNNIKSLHTIAPNPQQQQQSTSNKTINNVNNISQHIKIPQTSLHQQQSSTMTIQQMFQQHNNNQQQQLILINENCCMQTIIDRLVQQLVRCGFFCQQNQDSVMSLFGIARQVGNKMVRDDDLEDVVGMGGNNNMINQFNMMLSHSLYPIIMEKIKLTISTKYNLQIDTNQQHQLSQPIINHPIQSIYPHISPNTNNHNNISEFSTSQNHKQQIYYRNIQSISQLQVSDSMICDHQDQFIGKENNDFIYPDRDGEYQLEKEEEEGVINREDQYQQRYQQYQQLVMKNIIHSKYPIQQQHENQQKLYYGGYESDEVESFDIQLF